MMQGRECLIKNWQTEVEKHRMGGGGGAATQVASLIESHAFFCEEGFTLDY